MEIRVPFVLVALHLLDTVRTDVLKTLPSCSGKVMETQHTYSIVNVRSKLGCAVICNVDFNCKSFQYGERKCHLNQVKAGANCSMMENNTYLRYYEKGLICKNGGTIGPNHCLCINGYVGTLCERLMQDCSEGFVSPHGYNTDGVYEIQPLNSPSSFSVWCQMRNGGRTLFQKHYKSTFHFNKPWAEYKNGFGQLTSDHWLGLDKMYYITNNRPLAAVFYMRLGNGSFYQHYFQGFRITDESDGYRMSFTSEDANSRNPLGDSMTPLLNMRFTTYDRDNDLHATKNCATEMRSGWWYSDCGPCNPNGEFLYPSDYIQTQPYETHWFYDLQNLAPTRVQIWFTA